VLGRTGGEDGPIPFEELGLDPARKYLVFEFWERRYHGSDVTGSITPGVLPRPFNSQVFVIRERQDHPQVIATGRHITGGGPDLLDVSWSSDASRLSPGGAGGVLAGRSLVVGGDPYELFLTVPEGWRFVSMECDGGQALATDRAAAMVRTGCASEASAEMAWRARFVIHP
jgi:hypothetical protein